MKRRNQVNVRLHRAVRGRLVAYVSIFRGKFAGVSGIGLFRLRAYQMYQVIPAMPVSANGGAGEARTPDLRFRKPTLYPSELQPQDASTLRLS